MSTVLILFSLSLLMTHLIEAQQESIVKLSDQKVDGLTLRAILTPCKDSKKLHHGGHCGSQVEIKAWLTSDDPQTKFLVIDEVYDVQQKKNLRLLHPYMLQVSAVEQSLTAPLSLKQIVEVSCEVKDSVQRRQSEDSFHGSKGKDLIFYVPPPRTTTRKPQIVQKPLEPNLEAISGTYSVEKQKFQLKLNPQGDKQPQSQVMHQHFPANAAGNMIQQQIDLPMDGVDQQVVDTIQEEEDPKVYAQETVDNLTPSRDASRSNLQDIEQPEKNSQADFSESQDFHEIDDADSQQRTKFAGTPQTAEVKSPRPNPFKLPQPVTNSFARNNRLIEAKSNLYQKRINDHLQLMMNRYNPGSHRFGSNSHHIETQPQELFEPVDKEDDPNLLVPRKSVRPQSFVVNSYKARRRVKRVSDEFTSWDDEENPNLRKRQAPVTQKIAASSLGSFTRDYTLNVQMFRKQQENWLRMLSDVALIDEAANFTKGDLIVSSSLRTNSQPPDMQKVLLLAPLNGTSIERLIELGDDSKISSEEIQSEVCLSNEISKQTKRSVIKLHDFGFKSAGSDSIVDCEKSSANKCLRLQEIDPPTLKLEILLPFTNNEVIDPRESTVKIANIFVDTSDGSILFAQFEITSKDHTTKVYNLTFTGCNLLSPLNISHLVLLPPNKTVMVNLTIPLPFYAEHKEETCQANIVDQENRKVAERNFPLDPRGARCLCLWNCKCFCFGSFLTIQLSDLCNVMSPKGEFFAGFYDEKEFEEVEDEIFDDVDLRQVLVLWLPLCAFALILFVGFVKATLGCCSKTIGSWLFNFVYPLKKYSDVGCCGRYFGNLFLFFLLPFAGCFSLCVCRSKADERCGSDDSFLGKKLIRKQLHYDEESDYDNEDARLLRPTPPSSNYSAASVPRYLRSSETVFDIRSNPFDRTRENEIEDDTNFVVNAIKESHESLRKLESHHSQADTFDPSFPDADAFVQHLLAARVVYRRFNEAIGSVELSPGQAYTIRGYFIPSPGTGYQFMTYNPIRQVYGVSTDNKLTSLAPHISLNSKAFRRSYANKIEVFEVNDLSTHPSSSTPCINVEVQDISMYKN